MRSDWPPAIQHRTEILLVVTIVVLALILRIIAPWYAPRGWRDDELSSALVVTGHVLDGDFRVYYPDASGHEGLYEYFQAATILTFGPGPLGIRGPSILFGTMAVLLVYLITRRLLDWPTATIASIALTISFWSLMYSRTGQRHISVTVTTLLSFYFLWRGVQASDEDDPKFKIQLLYFGLSGVVMGLGFYTYFASRGVPLIVVIWAGYLLIWKRELLHRIWWEVALTLGLAALISIPLVATLQAQPHAETRVNEVAVPIKDAQAGNFSILSHYALTTISMFSHDGDEEWLYNVPHRPVFGVPGAILFWAGIIISLVMTFGVQHDSRIAFLLIWLAGGVAPGMLSVPAASLGHTILAQPVTMIFPALAVTRIGNWLNERQVSNIPNSASIVLALALIFLGWEAIRGIYDYWVVWPANSYNRVLHYTDLHEAAVWLNQNARTHDIAFGGFLLERWDQQAMKLDLRGSDWRVRVFDPRSAFIEIPGDGLAVIPEYVKDGWGGNQLGTPLLLNAPYEIRPINLPDQSASNHILARFDNGLVLNNYDTQVENNTLIVISKWHVERALKLPPFPLLSKPPAPGQDDRPRLAIFIQLLNSAGERIEGADGLGVDPYTLYPDDVFYQRMIIPLDSVPSGKYQLIIGLYNPSSSQRHLNNLTGRDFVVLQNWDH